MSAAPTNPGANMAAAVDAEVAKFRSLQTEIQELRSSQQTLIGQQNENEMVKQELDLLDEDSATVYKMVGPVLMKNDLDDAKQTVDKRLEYITGELKKLDKKVEDAQKKASESGEKIQQMQSAMQQAAAEAARAVAQQHSQQSSLDGQFMHCLGVLLHNGGYLETLNPLMSFLLSERFFLAPFQQPTMVDQSAVAVSSTDPSNAPSSAPVSPNDVVDVTVHPLVLLSAADHYHRVARGTRKRAVGVLLGTVSRGRVDATNSFAVPFEEDSKNPAVFYLDHNYLENMLHMFRKINAKERVVGFYSTGPQIRPNDLRIHALLKRFVPPETSTPPVFVIIDVRPDRESIPTTAYRVVEEVDSASSGAGAGGAKTSEVHSTFAHVPSLIGAEEPEEIGVEHLLRDINDPTVSTVTSLIKAKMSGLSALTEKLVEMKDYLEAVVEGRMKVNQEIVANMQTILNLLPNLNVDELVKSMLIKTNDMHMVIYLSALIRSVIALHDLVNNKIKYNLEGGLEEEDQKKTAADKDAGKKDGKGEEEKKEEDGDGEKKEKK